MSQENTTKFSIKDLFSSEDNEEIKLNLNNKKEEEEYLLQPDVPEARSLRNLETKIERK